MGPTIAAAVFAAFAIASAYVLRPRLGDDAGVRRAFFFWFGATPLLFFIYPILGNLAAVAALLALLAPKSADDRLVYYLIALFAVPDGIRAQIPFPGINYLIVIDFAMIACLVLLAPAAATMRRPPAARYAPAAGILLLMLTILMSVLEFRTGTMTNGLRASVEFVLFLALPYMAIIRLAPSLERFDKIFSAFLAIALICSCAAIVSEATHWNYYTHLTERHGLSSFADVREKLLRVSVTTNPALVGVVAGFGLLTIECFRARRKIGRIAAMAYRALFATTALFSFSRGAWLATAIGVLVYYFFSKFPRGLRPIVLAFALVAAIPATSFLMRADLSRIDPFGTFEYRRELLNASMAQIRERPLFGDPHFLESGNFDDLVQGRGIVDVVNYYLQITLEHGIVGLTLFFGAFAAVLIGLLRLGAGIQRDNDVELERLRALMLAVIAVYLVMIGTMSGVSLIPQVGVAVLALGAAFVGAARAAGEGRAGGAGRGAAAPRPAEMMGDLGD